MILALETGSLARKREIRFSINYFFKSIILPTFILIMVVKVGFEPTHPYGYLGLGQVRLPVPPFDHIAFRGCAPLPPASVNTFCQFCSIKQEPI